MTRGLVAFGRPTSSNAKGGELEIDRQGGLGLLPRHPGACGIRLRGHLVGLDACDLELYQLLSSSPA